MGTATHRPSLICCKQAFRPLPCDSNGFVIAQTQLTSDILLFVVPVVALLLLPFCRAPIVAVKNMPSGDVATNAWSIKTQKKAAAKAVASGQYSFYRDEFQAEILGQEPAPGRSQFKSLQHCLDACDDDARCVFTFDDHPLPSA